MASSGQCSELDRRDGEEEEHDGLTLYRVVFRASCIFIACITSTI